MLLKFRTYWLNPNHVSQPLLSPQSLINGQRSLVFVCVWHFITFVNGWKNRTQSLEIAFLPSSALSNKERKSESNIQPNRNKCLFPSWEILFQMQPLLQYLCVPLTTLLVVLKIKSCLSKFYYSPKYYLFTIKSLRRMSEMVLNAYKVDITVSISLEMHFIRKFKSHASSYNSVICILV